MKILLKNILPEGMLLPISKTMQMHFMESIFESCILKVIFQKKFFSIINVLLKYILTKNHSITQHPNHYHTLFVKTYSVIDCNT